MPRPPAPGPRGEDRLPPKAGGLPALSSRQDGPGPGARRGWTVTASRRPAGAATAEASASVLRRSPSPLRGAVLLPALGSRTARPAGMWGAPRSGVRRSGAPGALRTLRRPARGALPLREAEGQGCPWVLLAILLRPLRGRARALGPPRLQPCCCGPFGGPHASNTNDAPTNRRASVLRSGDRSFPPGASGLTRGHADLWEGDPRSASPLRGARSSPDLFPSFRHRGGGLRDAAGRAQPRGRRGRTPPPPDSARRLHGGAQAFTRLDPEVLRGAPPTFRW